MLYLVVFVHDAHDSATVVGAPVVFILVLEVDVKLAYLWSVSYTHLTLPTNREV